MTEASKAKNLIIDLRNNGGGAVMNMVHFLGLVMPRDATIGTFVSKQAVDSFVKEKGGSADDLKGIAEFAESNKIHPMPNPNVPVFKGKVAVLVNGGSGSASEISAQALKETLNAPIVGTHSAGAVLVSVMVPVANTGFQLQYPINDYVSAKGIRLEHTGVPVDIEVKTPQEIMPGKADPAWQSAVDLLAKMGAPKN